MQKTYLLVADSGRAKVFQSEDRRLRALELIHEESNPAGRMNRAELQSDRAGRQMGGFAGGTRVPHSVGDDNGERHEVEMFAKSLSRYLQRERQLGKYDKLMIAAPPQFLGDLRQNLSQDCINVLARTLNKDLLQANDKELISQFTAE